MFNYHAEYQKILNNIGTQPSMIYKYWGYKSGEVLGSFDTKQEAEEAGAKKVEAYAFNQEEVDKYRSNRTLLVAELDARWHKALREEYSELNDETYNIIYKQAYEDGHSAGYDEVANYMIDFSDMANKIIEANKG
jgi:flagellar biosynthesis/type III secretory pathway protein FliH